MINNFRHSGIVVSNLKVSENFYCKLLNFKILQRLVEKGPYLNKLINDKNKVIKVIKAALPDKTVLEIVEFQGVKRKKILKPRKYSPVGTIHLCYTVKKIDILYKRLKKNKVKFLSKPLSSIYDPVKTCFCYDPDYNLIQFVEEKQIRKK
ncbi:VOC family protein [Candidatus Pelagibacter sp.]|nr:VOC family protein [Candidatus Pelagibacter sp.]